MLEHDRVYLRLLDQVKKLPVVDCHEHMMGPMRPKQTEPIASLIMFYLMSDLDSASFGMPAKDLAKITDPGVPTDVKWPLFEQLWKRTEHTAYARSTKRVLRRVYGEKEMSRAVLEKVAARLEATTEESVLREIDAANIQALIIDGVGWENASIGAYLAGTKVFPAKYRPMIALPGFHPMTFGAGAIWYVGGLADRWITSLDEYLEAVFSIFQRLIDRGAIGFKDQSAYEREISYAPVAKGDAERLFNQVLADPRSSLGFPEGRLLNDFLFHQYMRFARDLKKPVQIHTGHMAGVYNRVDKTNAAHFASVLEVHRETRFDLFHGNWPYLGDYLFLAKNYANVALDLCWVHIIDPYYSIELLERAVQTVPHSKIHGFGGDFYGGDFGDMVEFPVAHLEQAQENISRALANLIEKGWLEEEQACGLAKAWLYDNPNAFFGLGLPDVE